MFAKNNSNGSVFTTTYTYNSNDKEYVFSCKGRPFVALVSSSLYTPASTLLDYNLIHQLGLKMTDIQCRKFFYGGHKLRILGRISTAVQCVQNGRIGGNFHIKGLVVSDLNTLLDTHCVAGSKMKEKLAHLSAQTMADEEEEEDDSAEDLNTSQEVTVMSSAPISQAKMSSAPSAPAQMTSDSPSPASALMTSTTTTSALMTSTITTAALMTATSTTTPVPVPPSPSLMYDNLGKGHKKFMETLTLLTGSQSLPIDAPQYNLYGPLGSDLAQKNEETWNSLKKEDPELALGIYKHLCGVQDWPDWEPGLTDQDRISLNSQPAEVRGNWLDNLERAKPKALCSCGFPHLNFKCRKSNHDKRRLHCQKCCDDPRQQLFCVFQV